MKHTLQVTLMLVLIFFVAQVVGLAITNSYIDHKATEETGEVVFNALPYDIERPPIEEASSFIYILIAILIGTFLVFLLIYSCFCHSDPIFLSSRTRRVRDL